MHLGRIGSLFAKRALQISVHAKEEPIRHRRFGWVKGGGWLFSKISEIRKSLNYPIGVGSSLIFPFLIMVAQSLLISCSGTKYWMLTLLFLQDLTLAENVMFCDKSPRPQ